jgi:tetratricopeptide (TPR) repeat protein
MNPDSTNTTEQSSSLDSRPLPESSLPQPSTITATIPAAPERFVGRQNEIDDLKLRLLSGSVFVSLVGMGGLGKSTLAQVVAHDLAAEGAFANGIFWVDVRKHTTLGAILVELADMLELELSQETLSQQQRAVNYTLGNRDALLILDNLEPSSPTVVGPSANQLQLRNQLHQMVVDGFSEEELRTLCFELGLDYDDLPARGRANKARDLISHLERHDRLAELVTLGPGFQKPQLDPNLIEFLSRLTCPVLTTSRVRPPGAQLIELDPLPALDAVRLFQLGSGLASEDLDQEVEELCNMDLEGHPLAIAVVGSLIASGLEVAEIRKDLKETPLDILSETVVSAGRSVADALQLSFKNLSPLAQDLLERMSIFPADFDLTALIALSPDHSRLRQVKGLRELIERSLLTQNSRNNYRLHPVTRQFAYALLADRALYHRRAGAYFLTEAGADSLAAMEQLLRAGEGEEAAALIAPNISAWIKAGRASRTLSACQDFDLETFSQAMRINVYEARGDLNYLLGDLDEALYQYEQANEAASMASIRVRVQLQRKRAEVLSRQGDHDEALIHLERGRVLLADTKGMADEQARVALGYGTAFLALGRYVEAITEANGGLDSLDANRDDPYLLADLQDLIGKANFFTSNFEESLKRFQMALSLRTNCSDLRGCIKSYSNLATVYGELNRYAEARQANETALEMAEKTGDVVALAVLYNNMAGDQLEQGVFDRAIKYSDRSLDLYQKMGNVQGMAIAHDNLGRIFLRTGRLELAAEHLDQAIELAGQVEDQHGVISGLKERAELRLAQGKINEALEDCLAAMHVADQEDSLFWRPEMLDLLGRIHYVRKEWSAADTAFGEASQIWRERQADIDLARTLLHWARLAQSVNEADRAREMCQEAAALAEAANDQELSAATSKLLAELAAPS